MQGTYVEGSGGVPLRFLFVSLQHVESAFYADAGAELERRGHVVRHVTFSRRAALSLRQRGIDAECLPDRIRGITAEGLHAEPERIAATYPVSTFRDIYRTDFVCDGRSEEWCTARTVHHMLAMEAVFDEFRPDVVVPEVGNETIRTVAHLVGVQRGAPVLFLLYTIFPRPLRLYVDSMHGPLVSAADLRELTDDERAELGEFRDRFIRMEQPIRRHRRNELSARRLKIITRHLWTKARFDRDNPYCRPVHWLGAEAREIFRRTAAHRYYRTPNPDRPFVYFPLHVADDYKLKRLIPHCADQVAIVRQVARALPVGVDLVVKEHPLSIGRSPLGLLRELRRMRNVRLVSPYTSSHELIRRSEAVTVISSTVGLEALLYAKPVMTLGEPFYSGLGVTLDLHSFAEIRNAVPRLLGFRPDRRQIDRFLHAAMRACYPGAPVLIDRSEANAIRLASSIEAVGSSEVARRRAVASAMTPGLTDAYLLGREPEHVPHEPADL